MGKESKEMKKKLFVIGSLFVALVVGCVVFVNKIGISMEQEGRISVAWWPGVDFSFTVYDEYVTADACTKEGIEKITIPDTIWGKPVKMVRETFCKYTVNPKEVEIGKNIEIIGTMAFYGCIDLKYVCGGENVREVGDLAFYECSILESVEFGGNLESIGQHAFEGCVMLKTLDTSDALMSVEYCAFANSGIKEIYIPDTAIIEKDAFRNTVLMKMQGE